MSPSSARSLPIAPPMATRPRPGTIAAESAIIRRCPIDRRSRYAAGLRKLPDRRFCSMRRRASLGASKIWYSIRLELARTSEFSRGSVCRAYIVHLPLLDCGQIDRAALRRDQSKAIVRRFWPGEPDLLGFVIPADNGWAFSYRDGPSEDEYPFNLQSQGKHLTLREPDGRELPYRIAEIIPLVSARSSKARQRKQA